MNLSKLQVTLPKLTTIGYNKTTGDFEEVLVSPHSFIRGDGLYISLEEGDGAGDYYESMYINPVLIEWAKNIGAYWEWQNAGCLSLSH
tara:strand:- start:2378 stop:2641 length:264 start_codon:yes stop_codon:yes gene_type:complete